MALFKRRKDKIKPRPPAPTPPPGPPPADAMLAALNQRRVSAGLTPLSSSSPLMSMAAAQADSMARSGKLSHGDFAGRVAGAIPNRLAAENIAQGQPDVESAVASWMGSEGHRKNILGPYDSVGWGMADGTGGRFWCAVFAELS